MPNNTTYQALLKHNTASSAEITCSISVGISTHRRVSLEFLSIVAGPTWYLSLRILLCNPRKMYNIFLFLSNAAHKWSDLYDNLVMHRYFIKGIIFRQVNH